MLIKKNIVLHGVKESSQKALLTIECDGLIAEGKLRLYNFGEEPKGIISLGIYQKGEVVKAGLIHYSQMLYTFNCQLNDISKDFSCAVINFVNGEPTPILYGNGEGYIESDEIFSQVLKELNKSQNVEEVEETLDKYGIDFDDELKDEIEEKIDSCLQSGCDCENCEYKKFYLENINAMSMNNAEELNEKVDEIQEEKEDVIEKKFYLELKPQIDKLFENNPSEDYLEKLLPNSKFVKVKIDDNGNYYVLGLIYENDKLIYICYGVPGVYQKNAPRELSGYPIWFPLEQSNPQGFGYWLSYQDAESGESVKAVIV